MPPNSSLACEIQICQSTNLAPWTGVQTDAWGRDESLSWLCPLNVEDQLCALQLVGLWARTPELDAACRAYFLVADVQTKPSRLCKSRTEHELSVGVVVVMGGGGWKDKKKPNVVNEWNRRGQEGCLFASRFSFWGCSVGWRMRGDSNLHTGQGQKKWMCLFLPCFYRNI